MAQRAPGNSSASRAKPVATLSADFARPSAQLYCVIVMTTSGLTLDKCSNAGVNKSFEEWRQFAMER